MKRAKSIMLNQIKIDERDVIYQECFYEYSAEKREIENFVQPTEENPLGSFNLVGGVNKYIIYFAHYEYCLPMWKIAFIK